MSSYFRLRKYNIVSKFVESREMIKLEKRFSHMITLDVSKCFYNIYTHSLSWAVKGKRFTKSELGAFTFEDEFDALMQAANYKETNGIVVGPEVSRIFAEIIFQQIDKELIEKLDQDGWSRRKYAVHRYVDDYFIFSNNAADLEHIEKRLAACLERFKLYLNTDKRSISQRPFVTPISRLKRDIVGIIGSVSREILQVSKVPGFIEHKAVAEDIRQKLRDLRLAVAPEEVGFHNISGWLMWKLRKICSDSILLLRSAPDEQAKDSASHIVAAVMELAFYITALDCRVRTGFNLTLLLAQVFPTLESDKSEQSDFLQNLIFEEFVDLTDVVLTSRDIEGVEVCNLMLAGAHIFRSRYVRLRLVENSLQNLANKIGSYTAYLTAKFCYLKDEVHFARELEELNKSVERHIIRSSLNFKEDTQLYLLVCDLISAPDVDVQRKQRVLDHVLAKERASGTIGHITASTATELARLVGFVDWYGVRLRHTLARRQLRGAREY
jgi:Reverse transcriptase (RNA-dependent DNA polymerase).